MTTDLKGRTLVMSQSLTLTADGTAVNAQDWSAIPGRRLRITLGVAGTIRVALGYGTAPTDPSAIATADATGIVVTGQAGAAFEFVSPERNITHAKFRGTGTTAIAVEMWTL